MSHKITIIHYYPIDAYPPALNFFNYLKKEKHINATVISIKHRYLKQKSGITYFKIAKLKWLAVPIFSALALIKLILKRPDIVIYYDTISCWPSILYKKYFNKKIKLYVHYHELITNNDIANESRSVRILKVFEKKNLNLINLISHTNEVRKDIFLTENSIQEDEVIVVPNYPPKSWSESNNSIKYKGIKKFVFVGSIDIDAMYVKEICEILNNLPVEVSLDIYSYYINEKTHSYLKQYSFVRVNGPIEYHLLPNILSNYNIGLILYQPSTSNFKHNATNKLFEYHAFGLQIWYPSEMIYIESLHNRHEILNLVKVDFKNPSYDTLGKEIRSTFERSDKNLFVAELEFEKLYMKLTCC